MDTPDAIDLCERGAIAESVGLVDLAADLYRHGWAAASNPGEQCLSAHHLARVQTSPQECHDWNLVALDRAAVAGPDFVDATFRASLLVAAAGSARSLGDAEAAADWYRLAAQAVDASDNVSYTALRAAIADGLSAVAAPHPANNALRELAESHNYGALMALLPHYVDAVIDQDNSGLSETAETLATHGLIPAGMCSRLASAPTHSVDATPAAPAPAFPNHDVEFRL